MRVQRVTPSPVHVVAARLRAKTGCDRGRRHTASVLLFASLLFGPPVVTAQSLDAVFSGQISDATGAGLPGVTVTAIDDATGIRRASATDGEGRFVLLHLPASTYTIRAELDGFAPKVLTAQTLHVGTIVAINLPLAVAGVAHGIEVRGHLPVLETGKNTLSRIVQVHEIDALPVINRNFNDLAALAPGVTKTGVYGGVDISGSRDFQNAYQVDGVSAERQRLGDQQIPYAQDWIQEFQVLTSQFNAEFGQAAGGVLNAITRSGGNQIAGRVYGFLRNDAWDAMPALVSRASRRSASIGSARRSAARSSKGRLFYFAGVERFAQRVEQRRQFLVCVRPTARSRRPTTRRCSSASSMRSSAEISACGSATTDSGRRRRARRSAASARRSTADSRDGPRERCRRELDVDRVARRALNEARCGLEHVRYPQAGAISRTRNPPARGSSARIRARNSAAR